MIDHDELEDDEKIQVTGPNGEEVFFVNVWDITRLFGGPEEGGWWYDTGQCIKTVVCLTWEQAETTRETLRVDYPTTDKRYSVLGGDDYNVTIDDEQGTYFPESRPHYE